MKEWLSASEIAALALPGLPDTARGVNVVAKREKWRSATNSIGAFLSRKRPGNGGGFEYHYSLFPSLAQARLTVAAKPELKASMTRPGDSAVWAEFEKLTDKQKAKAQERLEILDAVEMLVKGGTLKNVAVNIVANQRRVGSTSIFRWFNEVASVSRTNWLPWLAPRHAGRVAKAECHPDAWEMIKADYLRLEQPPFESCYRRLTIAAQKHGWEIPPCKTLLRRIKKEINPAVMILARKGNDALKKMYPAQERDRSIFHALEAINADGHKFDVFVRWPGEELPIRVMMVAMQDLYSGLIIGWRVDKSENKESVRLCIGDVIENYGIPSKIWLDNGRGFASKWLTGGIPNRFRFKIKDDDPVGILTSLGVEVHWATPYSGQSKPIERAFRDMCSDIAKHPAFAGAYTGNRPDAKPENYMSRAIPLDQFLQVVSDGINEHNTRTGRRAAVANGRSFSETFNASYAQSPIKVATEEQRRLWLLAAEGIMASRTDGTLKLMGNRFWADFMHNHMGEKLIVRFDPQDLKAGVFVYRLNGSYLGYADTIEAKGFDDVGAARDHGRARRAFNKATKTQLEALRTLNPQEVADLLPDSAAPIEVQAKVVQMVSTNVGNLRPDIKPVEMTESEQATQAAVIEDIEKHRAAPKPLTAADRYHRAQSIKASLDAKDDVKPEDLNWLNGYLGTDEFKTQQMMVKDFGEDALVG